uniref:YchJ family protein n=1 Tax=Desulfosarcina sp. TaxID=2027861 RepID=UPI003563DCE8
MALCPCGSGKDYEDCCGPLIKGDRVADTAEDLMRSRYTAHAKKNFDYIFETTHPSNRQEA